MAEGNGEIIYVDATTIRIKYDRTEDEEFTSFEDAVKTYEIPKFRKTNQNTTIDLRPICKTGQKVSKGDILTEGYSTENGELAIGRNLKVAFMPWKGYNFEDAIVLNERLVAEDIFTSVHVEEFSLEVRETKRGIEELTSDILDRAMELADAHGIGVVALKNANHWMRGGSYGEQAAKKGYVGICWTNSIAAMPPWGGKEPRIGTNPIIIAVPSDPVTYIDMSCSMFSYGKLEVTRLAGQQTPIDAGFDDDGNPTRDPGTVEKNRRLMPAGYWKGSGLSIVLDMVGVLLTGGGLSVPEITEDQGGEFGVTEIFIAIDVNRLIDGKTKAEKLKRIMDYVTESARADENVAIRLPGHETPKIMVEHEKNGIPVDDRVWEKLLSL